MNLQVAAAHLADCRSVARIHVDAWRVAYEGIVPAAYLASLSVEQREAMWRAAVQRRSPTVLVARADGGVVGWIAYDRSRDEGAGADVGEVWAVYVAPSAWSSGVGRALWEAARADMRRRGFRLVTLWVIRGNSRANRFYQRLGFEEQPDSARSFELGGAQIGETRFAIRLQTT